MKVICERNALLAAVNHVASVVPTRTPSQSLTCIKLIATKTGAVSELTLAGTDNETSVELSISKVDVVKPGTALVSAEKLRQIVQALETDHTLNIDLEGDVCLIRGAASRFKIFAFPADQYPEVPDLTKAIAAGVKGSFALDAGTFLTLINRTIYATSKESSRYAINGVLLKRDGKKLEMVATDGKRLAMCKTMLKTAQNPDLKEAGPSSCVVPTKGLNLFTRVVGDPNETIRLVLTENRVFITFEDVVDEDGKKKGTDKTPARAVVSITLYEGTFPQYEEVIPKDNDKKITVDREALAAKVREAKILTNEESRGVRMSFSAKSKRLKLTSRAPEMGESDIDVDLANYEGDDIEISFNPEFITDALRSIEEPEVVIELKTTAKPGLIRSGTEFLYVVMPVNLGS
ncbi:MAG: DNA polymerase III subunit beta [Phycisphaerales bacterium]